MKELVEKWMKYIKGLPSEKAEIISTVLENQMILNMTKDESLHQISIAIVRMMMDTKLMDLISVQPLLPGFDSGRISFFKHNQIAYWEVVPQFRPFQRCWVKQSSEGELIKSMSAELKSEIERMVLSDLCNYAGLHKSVDFNSLVAQDKITTIKKEILQCASNISELYGRPFINWIVASYDMLGIFGMHSPESNVIARIGTWESEEADIEIYTGPMYNNTILLGYKGDHPSDAGYVFSPGGLFSVDPLNYFTGRQEIKSQFASRLVVPSYYAKLRFNNYDLTKNVTTW